jgi:uncharacterized protein
VNRPRTTLALPQLFLGLLSLAIAAVWIAHIFSATIHDARHTRDTVVITGSARVPISSNLVQWSLNVDGSAATPIEAARRQRQESAAVLAFLRGAGISTNAISPQVVRSEKEVTPINKSDALAQKLAAVGRGVSIPIKTRTTFHVYQGFQVSTRDIDVVERAASGVGTLLEHGIAVSAEPLAYISTDLEQAKLDALQAATAEARRRAEIIVKGLGGKLGSMRASSLGVYQITPRNSTDVSDYGINDTSSRLKDVTAVVSATFAVRR